MQRPSWRIGLAALVVVVTGTGLDSTARAQWRYPRYYGGYGYSRWGADPGAGYMAALGSYAKNQGAYEVQAAQARAIERDSLIKWNKALMAQRQILRQQQEEEAARRAAIDAERDRENAVKNGSTLNTYLEQILELNPYGLKSPAANRPITVAAIKDIPFEPATEAISICLDQLAAEDALPFVLQRPEFASQRAALRSAVLQALQEDTKGSVSRPTMDALTKAVTDFRDAFRKRVEDTDPGYIEADEYLRTLAGLSRLLHNPNFQRAIAEIQNFQEGTLADLITFMSAFNLRFGPARSDQQVALYQALTPQLAEVLKESGPAPARTERPGVAFRNAAKDAFRGLTWTDIDAQSQNGR